MPTAQTGLLWVAGAVDKKAPNAFALQCGMDRQNMSRLELGKINPSVYSLYPIAKELGLEVRDLWIFNKFPHDHNKEF